VEHIRVDNNPDDMEMDADSIAMSTHAVLEDVLPSFNGAILVDNGDGIDTEQALRAHPTVDTVVADFFVHAAAQTQVLERMGVLSNGNLYDPHQADTECSVDADVAVIDTGIDLDHPQLNVVAGVDCTIGQCREGEGMGDDDQGHGTFVAGIIGAKSNSGVVGVAPGVRLYSVKVLDSDGRGWASQAVKAVDYVINNTPVTVVNFSFGGRGQESDMCNILARAAERGITFAASAGNDRGEKVEGYWPANCPHVISVGSMVDTDGLPGSLGSAPSCGSSSNYLNDRDDSRSFFSNVGANITAIGSCVKSTLRRSGYGIASGTSMAAPAVAGALAILSSQNRPRSLIDVDRMYSTILDNGKFDWIDGPEPRLDVQDEDIFSPNFVGCATAPPSMREVGEEEDSFEASSDPNSASPFIPCDEHPEATFIMYTKKGPKSRKCSRLSSSSNDRSHSKYCVEEVTTALSDCPVTCSQCTPLN